MVCLGHIRFHVHKSKEFYESAYFCRVNKITQNNSRFCDCLFPGVHCPSQDCGLGGWCEETQGVEPSCQCPESRTGLLCYIGKSFIHWGILYRYRLIHFPLYKTAVIWQTIFSDAFSWMALLYFEKKNHWRLFLRVQLTTTRHWFR